MATQVTSLAVAVVGHVDRIEQGKALAHDLDAELFVDDAGLGEWANHARALAWAAEQSASHALIVQDDAVPVLGMLDHAHWAAGSYPGGPIGCYVGRVRPRPTAVTRAVRRAEQLDASWLEADTLLWGVATIIPTADIPDILDRPCSLPYDERIGEHYRRRRIPVRYTWPSLVDHADMPSVIEGRRERRLGRVAWRVGVPHQDGCVVRIDRA